MRNLWVVPLLLIVALVAITAEKETIELPALGKVTISGPYQHDNLVVVKETNDVNRLVVKNVSDDHVFIQAGDIVKGGKQDRLMAYDLLLAPGSGKVSIGAFCVEQGRWSGRGNESAMAFAPSMNRAAGNALKSAYREEKSQQEVWRNVAKTQVQLEEAVAVDVRSSASPTSLELSLDTEAVKRATEAYEKALGTTIDNHDDAIGVVAVIGGEIQSANLYAWHDLFAAVWPRLLSELSADAVASGNGDREPATLSAEQLKALLAPTAGASTKTNEIAPGLSEEQARYGDSIRFVSKDEKLGWTRAEALKKKD
jgi:hypothetical protein